MENSHSVRTTANSPHVMGVVKLSSMLLVLSRRLRLTNTPLPVRGSAALQRTSPARRQTHFRTVGHRREAELLHHLPRVRAAHRGVVAPVEAASARHGEQLAQLSDGQQERDFAVPVVRSGFTCDCRRHLEQEAARPLHGPIRVTRQGRCNGLDIQRRLALRAAVRGPS